MFTCLPEIPLHPRLAGTPLNRDAPLAPVCLEREGGASEWVVVRCPYCGGVHRHGADGADDLRRMLGGRVAHCDHEREYRLIAIEGDPTEAELDAHFPKCIEP